MVGWRGSDQEHTNWLMLDQAYLQAAVLYCRVEVGSEASLSALKRYVCKYPHLLESLGKQLVSQINNSRRKSDLFVCYFR